MTSSDTLSATPGSPVAWDPDVIFSILSDAARRQVLAVLARSGPQPASVLRVNANRRFDATVKQLGVMERAGLLVTSLDRTDKRRTLYGLSPALPLVKSEATVTVDFGFCLLRL